MFGNLFGGRDLAIYKLREKVIALRLHCALLSKRMSYLETRHPEIFQHLIKKDRPVARIRDAEKQQIISEIDAWLEELK